MKPILPECRRHVMDVQTAALRHGYTGRQDRPVVLGSIRPELDPSSPNILRPSRLPQGKLPPDKVISTNKLGAEERERRRAQRMTAEVSHMSPVQMPGGHKQRTAATAVCSTP